MGFFSGRVSFARYQLLGQSPDLFGREQLEELLEYQAGRPRLAAADGIEVGWTAGDHILDIHFELAKNIINDMLHFALRIDTDRPPSDLLKAYYQMELEAQAKDNPSGKPSVRQKREAREAAEERIGQEAQDGRYKKRKAVPVVWDRISHELLFGTTSVTQVDRLYNLFQHTFDLKFEAVTAGRRAFQLAELHQQTRNVDDAAPSAFVPGFTPSEVAWVLDETSRDFLGNEFLLWLWFTTEEDEDTISLADGSEVAVMLARTLTLDCPRAQTGHETINSDGPTRLPEARRAIQAGKWPRKAGLTLVRHSKQYELTLHAETLAVGSAKLPPPEDDETTPRMVLDGRATRIRDLIETLDLLFEAFCVKRFGGDWSRELLRMQKWLQRDERPRKSA